LPVPQLDDAAKSGTASPAPAATGAATPAKK
jgi:hypothetical protein